MPNAAFLAEIIDATAAIDDVLAEPWLLTPMTSAPEVTAPRIVDPNRAEVPFVGIFSDLAAKPEMPNSYDRRQVRRPGEDSGHPILRVSPAQLAAQVLVIRQGDLVKRVIDGVTWRVASAFVMAGGTLHLTINIVG